MTRPAGRAQLQAGRTRRVQPFDERDVEIRCRSFDDDDLRAFLRSLPPTVDAPSVIAAANARDRACAALLADLWERHSIISTRSRAAPSRRSTRWQSRRRSCGARLVAPTARPRSLRPRPRARSAKLLDGSIEEWMVYLHPSQRAIANANFNGPARVRGGPGTGKTVVALHRARVLARKRVEAPRQGAPDDVPEHAPQGVDVPDGHCSTSARLNGSTSETSTSSLASSSPPMPRPSSRFSSDRADQESPRALLKRHGLPEAMANNPQLLLDEFDAFIAGRGIEPLETTSRCVVAAAEAASAALIASAYSQRSPSTEPTLLKRKAYDWPHIRLKALELAESGAARATTASSSTRPRTSARSGCACCSRSTRARTIGTS